MTEREAFAAAIRENPHDLAAHCAFADYLAEQGDPRGEFMQVQIALEDEKAGGDERAGLHAREAELLAAHEAEWVGDWPRHAIPPKGFRGRLGAFGGRKYVFERGLLAAVGVGHLRPSAALEIVYAPTLGFVRELFVGATKGYGDVQWSEYDAADLPPGDDYNAYPYWDEKTQEVVEVGPEDKRGDAEELLLKWPQLKYIRRFTWGYPAGGDGRDSCWTHGDYTVRLAGGMPDIEELRVFAHVYGGDVSALMGLPMPRLRVFELYHTKSYPFEVLAANRTLGGLTHLHCHPHALYPGDKPYIRLAGLQALCRSGNLPALVSLRLRCADFGDAGVREIVSSGLLTRLKVLDLMFGCVTDAGALALAGCPDFRRLESLRIDGNALTADGIDALRRTGVPVTAEQMHHATDSKSTHAHEFLHAGDWE